jgi:hypothetical protein
MKKANMILTSILAIGAVSLPLYGAQAAPADPVTRGSQQLQELFNKIDMDKSGNITMEEYMIYHNHPVSAKYGEYFQFRAMDADDNQRLSLNEVRAATDPFNPTL